MLEGIFMEITLVRFENAIYKTINHFKNLGEESCWMGENVKHQWVILYQNYTRKYKSSSFAKYLSVYYPPVSVEKDKFQNLHVREIV